MPPGDKTLQKQAADLQNTQNADPIQQDSQNQMQNQMQDQTQNLIQNQMQPSAEEMEEARAAARRQAEAMRQARIRRESRIRAVRQGCRIAMPEVAFTQKGVTVQGEQFARRSNESISAGKRKTRQGWKRSALYRKEANARLVESGVEAWEESRREIIRSRPLLDTPPMEVWGPRILLFMNGEAEKDDELFQHAISQDEEAIARICKDRFMEMNLNFDLRTDQSFGEASGELEGLTRKVRELKRLLEACPQVRENLTEDERTDLDAKLEVAQNLSNYYEIRKKVITNARYRSHYNSEISYRYHESDTLEAKNLTVLLWQAESLRSSQSFGHPTDLEERLRNYRETVQDKNEAAETLAAREKLRAVDAEYGKNRYAIEDSRHANYFREFMLRDDDPVVQRLVNDGKYRVAGMQETMSESFVRNLSNLPRWRAVQNASAEYIRSMVQNLARRPGNAEDPEEVERCRNSNLEGMRQFKALLKKQTDYLRRKYGNGLLLISADELARHGREFENDFTNMQGLGAFIDYLKKLPGMFDSQDESDLEMERLFTYYDRCTMGEGRERRNFLNGIAGSGTYSDYKRNLAVAAVGDRNLVEPLIRLSDTMHLDIRWDTVFDESDLKVRELPNVLRQAETVERIGRMEEADRGQWQHLFPETRDMTAAEAAKHFVEKEAGERLETMSLEYQVRKAWLNEGLNENELLENWHTIRGDIVRRRRMLDEWKLNHPGQREPVIGLAGNARRVENARNRYAVQVRIDTAAELAEQYRQLAEGMQEESQAAAREVYGALAEDFHRTEELFRRQLSRMRAQA